MQTNTTLFGLSITLPIHSLKALKQGVLLFLLLFTGFVINAADVRVYTLDSQGNPIAGTFKIQKGPNFIGTFNSGDTANLTAGDTYTIWAIYQNTSTERVNLTVSSGGDSLGFKTTNVKFHFSGGYLDYRGSGSWKSFGPKVGGEWPARELFPYDFYGDTMRINIGHVWNDVRGIQFDIFYGGLTSVEKTLAVIRVLDSDGNPTQGATARGGYNSPTTWHVAGSTNANGLLLDIRDGDRSSLAYEAKVNGTVAEVGPKNPKLDSYYLFQTDEVVLKLESCTGTPLAGGNARFGSGSTFTTRWFPNNPGTSTDINGMVTGQMFPGTYSFDMQYEHTSDQKLNVVIPAGGDTITWKTVNVVLNYAGTISYGGATGDAAYFNSPKELLPGTYKFNFRGTGREDLTLSGCSFAKTALTVDVLDCHSGNQAGVDVQWYVYGNANNKHSAGTTGSTSFPVLVDDNLTQVGIVVNYLGQTNTLVQNINTNSTFTFPMVDVALELWNHDSTSQLVPQDVQFYVYGKANNKMAFPGSLHKCLLPGKYGFEVKYNETSEGRNNIDVVANNPVVFQTGLVDDLTECSFNPTTYYQYGSANNSFVFTDPMEFMPSRVGVRSSTNPLQLIDVQAQGVHRLSECSIAEVMDSCVSDSNWLVSSVVTPSNYSGWWGGVASLPHDSTFKNPAEVGQPFAWGGITELPGTMCLKAGSNISYFSKSFGLTDTSGIEARFRMYMDDGTEIYINGQLIAREENMDRNNSRGVPHDLFISSDNTLNNGYLGGDQFDYIPSFNLETLLRKGTNTLVIVLRNPANPNNVGGLSFRMDMTKDGKSVLVKKDAEVKRSENLLLTAYPNPIVDVLTFEVGEVNYELNRELSVYSLNGQLMLHRKFSTTEPTYQVDLNKLKRGIYFVRLTSGNEVRYAKIIKE